MGRESRTHYQNFSFSSGADAAFLAEQYGNAFRNLATLETEGWLFDWDSLQIETKHIETFSFLETDRAGSTVSISVRGLRNNREENYA